MKGDPQDQAGAQPQGQGGLEGRAEALNEGSCPTGATKLGAPGRAWKPCSGEGAVLSPTYHSQPGPWGGGSQTSSPITQW